MDVLIPNLGDIDQVEVIEITVSPGDQVQENDGLIVIESDKASMEVPCPSDGVVEEILVTVGDMVGEGHPVAKIRALDGTNSEQSDLQELPDISGEESATNDVASPNRIDFLIPDVLLHWIIETISCTAKALQGHRQEVKDPIGAISFDQRQ